MSPAEERPPKRPPPRSPHMNMHVSLKASRLHLHSASEPLEAWSGAHHVSAHVTTLCSDCLCLLPGERGLGFVVFSLQLFCADRLKGRSLLPDRMIHGWQPLLSINACKVVVKAARHVQLRISTSSAGQERTGGQGGAAYE
ncbi:hypothetical protein CesoFtcFv8_025682 [Champsocephalus esox]|uniref:Uncharacterized protein n=1 Tax=Champsocephalus esox TaxID=159716 RepID=A0AAN8B0U1_9TELE|nr:hypothetical protein CesoFtcFv8_025682 [Champsocephalus esox]